jgi:hypothetical protein
MTAGSKQLVSSSKELLLSLFFVTILFLLLVIFLPELMVFILRYHQSLLSMCHLLVELGMLLTYIWVMRASSLFKNTSFKHLRFSLELAFLILSMIALLSWFTLGKMFLMLNNRVATFNAPIPGNQVCFYQQGDDFRLYATPQNKKKRFVMRLEEEGYYRFSYAEWTRDGEIVILYFVLLDEVSGDKNDPIIGGAYDFTNNKALVPSWINSDFVKMGRISEWERFNSSIKPLIVAHNGLCGSRISTDLIIEQKEWR